MKYFIAAFIVVFALASLSGDQQETQQFDYYDGSYSEIICELGQGDTCVENITFPAMHITAQVTK